MIRVTCLGDQHHRYTNLIISYTDHYQDDGYTGYTGDQYAADGDQDDLYVLYAGDHCASGQHHGDQGTVCMLVISATFGKLLHSEFGSINTLLPPTCVLSSLINEDSSSPSSLNYFYKYSVLSKLYAG